MDDHIPKRIGNPAWVKGGASPNPAGRKSVGDSLADAMRRKFPPARIVELAERLAETADSDSVRLSALLFIADRAHGKVATDLNLHATMSDGEDARANAALIANAPLAARREALAYVQRSRALLAAAAAIDTTAIEKNDQNQALIPSEAKP